MMLRDPEFGPTRVRAFGTYTIRVTDPARFMTEIVGTDGDFTPHEIEFQIRNIIVQKFPRGGGQGIPVLDMAANTRDLGKLIAEAIAPDAGRIRPRDARVLHREHLAAPEVEKALDKRTSMGIVGDLEVHPVRRRRGDDDRRRQPRAAAAAWARGWRRHGMGMGMAMANQMAGPAAAIAQAGAAAPPPPPPPPVGAVWHIAEAGATAAPSTRRRCSAWRPRAAADPRNDGLDRRAGRLEAGRRVPALAGSSPRSRRRRRRRAEPPMAIGTGADAPAPRCRAGGGAVARRPAPRSCAFPARNAAPTCASPPARPG
jgi:hypothetical protein